MQKITFQDTTILKKPYVVVNDLEYEVQDGTYDGGTDLNASTFNTMQNNIETAINNVDAKIDGTNWANLTYINTYSSLDETNYNPLQYKKIGNQVFIRGMIQNSVANPTGYSAVCSTLPENFRPQKNCYFSGNNSDSFITVVINSNGEIRVFNTSTNWISLDGISFFID